MADSNYRFWSLIVGIVGLGVVVSLLALRYDKRLSRIELLERAPSAPPLEEIPHDQPRVAAGQTVYVPVYSHVYLRGGNEQLLEVTLSIRNTDLDDAIVVKSIRYYDNEGRELREYLGSPILLRPLASTDFLVEERDTTGGVGANFLVEWVAEAVVTEPLIEAVMVGSEGNRAFAFARPGVPISTEEGSESSVPQ